LTLIFVVNYHSAESNERSSEQVRIAYLFLVNDVPTAQGVARLVQLLYKSKHTFVIHVDTDADIKTLNMIQNLTQKFNLFNNTLVISTQKVWYNGISLVQAMMDLIYFAIHTGRGWDFAITLSGFDYVLKTPRQIEERLQQQIGFNFLSDDGTSGFESPVLFNNRLQTFYLETKLGVQKVVDKMRSRRYIPPGLTVRFGSPWTVLSRSFCEYLMIEDLPRNLLVLFATTIHPAEMYFQTIAYNTHFREKTYENRNANITLRFTKWLDPRSSDVATLDLSSLNEMFESNALFVRKLPPMNQTIYDEINRRIQSNDPTINPHG